MTFYVILINGKPMEVNDEDNRWLLCRSKSHALRIIKWLGLKNTKVREATEEEVAEGVYTRAHETPNWFGVKTTKLPVPEHVATIS